MSKTPPYAKLLEEKLVEDLINRGHEVISNKKFQVNNHDGECDAIILNKTSKRKYALIFEAKCREKHKRSARDQLQKDRAFIHKKYGKKTKCFSFFVYSSKDYELGKIKKAYTIEWMIGL